jgi:uncharacterized protein
MRISAQTPVHDTGAAAGRARRQGGRARAGRGQAIAAELRWAAARGLHTYDRLVRVPRTVTPTATPDRCSTVRVQRDLPAVMRDGVRLRADLYLPGNGAFATVLIRQPYGKRDHPFMEARGRYWARKGYACVVQDVRGKWSSQGAWRPWSSEPHDGYDTLDWIAGSEWCNGAIGMVGESYYGMTQWAVAALGHPNLRCIAPGDSTPDPYGMVYPGGAFALPTMGEWAYEMDHRRLANPFRFDPWHLPLISTDDAAGRPSPVYKEQVRHPSRDAFWDKVDCRARAGAFSVPALHWGGWYDLLVSGTIAGWQEVRARAASAHVRENQWLMLAPTDHALGPMYTGRVGRLGVGNEAWSFDRVQRFFDFWLRGEANAVDRSPRVQYFTVGPNEWRTADEWPPASAQLTNFYLHSRGGAGAGPLQLRSRRPRAPLARAQSLGAGRRARRQVRGRIASGRSSLHRATACARPRGDRPPRRHAVRGFFGARHRFHGRARRRLP